MSKNIGLNKKEAESLVIGFNRTIKCDIEAYVQREEHFNNPTYQWIVVLQKLPKHSLNKRGKKK